ncbi:ketimine reductase mu-crystallin [Drosophila innubila]|uniref:ketimine reductase mu-crystallin n=1 Tax=Drosophila innubila TaxID=198719 RepID=UPI00148D1677|nr:ketimine reductase mu-crystallin [Drosophila innubila]
MNQSPVFYAEEAVRRVLSWTLVNEAVEEALKAVAAQSRSEGCEGELSGGQECSNPKSYVSQPMRSCTKAGSEPGQMLFTMPAFVGNYRLTAGGAAGGGGGGDASKTPRSTLACKLVTSFRGNRDREPPLPSISANILLFNVQTGSLETIMAGTDITTWRTASASVVATKYLYFRRFGPCAEHELEINVAIIGCGVQGKIHATAMCENFKVKQLNLYNRTESRATQLAAQLRQRLVNSGLDTVPNIVVCSTARAAVHEANVICVATYSRDPLINAEDLGRKRPIHINAIGAGEVHFGEVSTDIYQQSKVYVDSMANADQELRDFPAPIVGEVGAVINSGNIPESLAITVFQSMGMASEDACVAEAVLSALQSETRNSD